jgi:hypothetical protein
LGYELPSVRNTTGRTGRTYRLGDFGAEVFQTTKLRRGGTFGWAENISNREGGGRAVSPRAIGEREGEKLKNGEKGPVIIQSKSPVRRVSHMIETGRDVSARIQDVVQRAKAHTLMVKGW